MSAMQTGHRQYISQAEAQRTEDEITRLRAINAELESVNASWLPVIAGLKAINAELLAALKALNLAFYGIPFAATPEEIPALQAASEMARAAITAAEKG